MPTYKNTTQNVMQLILSHTNDYTKVNPFQTVESEIIYSVEGLEEVLPSPYFNPILEQTNVQLLDDSDEQTININPDSKNIEIINSSSNTVYIYFQSSINTPPTILTAGMTKLLSNFYRYFNKIIIKSSNTISANQVFVSQYLE